MTDVHSNKKQNQDKLNLSQKNLFFDHFQIFNFFIYSEIKTSTVIKSKTWGFHVLFMSNVKKKIQEIIPFNFKRNAIIFFKI